MFAQIAEAASRKVCLDKFVRCGGEQYLSAVSGIGDAFGKVRGHPLNFMVFAIFEENQFAGVNADTHLYLADSFGPGMRFECFLHINGALDSGTAGIEEKREGIAFIAEFLSVPLGCGCLQNRFVCGEDI